MPTVVPSLPSFEARLQWACDLRHIDQSSLLQNAIVWQQNATRARRRCDLCNTSLAADKRTVARHLNSRKHARHIATRLNVEYSSLRAPHLKCGDCDASIAGIRSDAMRRHHRVCSMRASSLSATPVPGGTVIDEDDGQPLVLYQPFQHTWSTM